MVSFKVKVFIRSLSLKLNLTSFAFKPCCKIILFTPFN